MPAEPQSAVRAAVPADAERVAAIFAHYVTSSVATFEEVAPTADQWRQRLADRTARNLPFVVAEADGSVCGYAYASPWRPKPAYRYTVEDSVFLAPGRCAAGHRGHRRHRQRRVGRAAPPVRLHPGRPALRRRPQARPLD